jgi:hypothetical protein
MELLPEVGIGFPDTRFAPDSPLEGAVRCELVSKGSSSQV